MTAPVELRFRSQPENLKRVREAVKRHVTACGAGPGCAEDVVLAVDEACQNVIRHAYGEQVDGEILLRIDREGSELVFSLIDFAPRVDPSQVHPRDLDEVRPGGIGTHLIQEVMDSAGFEEPPPGCGNLFRMRKRLS